jgi:hypothetical protein
MQDKVYVDTVGLEVIIDMGDSVVGATNIVLNVMKPGGTETTWGAANVYLTRFIRYLTVANDINEVGLYKIQPEFELDGWSGPTKTVSFRAWNRYE